MKLSDYVADFLVGQGVKHVFVVTGGASAHLIDSVGQKAGIEYICNQHEQACAMAADAYARVTRNLGVVMVTSGPGATNLFLLRFSPSIVPYRPGVDLPFEKRYRCTSDRFSRNRCH